MTKMEDILNVNYNSVKDVIGFGDYSEDLSGVEAVLMAFINYKNNAPSNAENLDNYNIKDFKLEKTDGSTVSSKDLEDLEHLIFPSYVYTNDVDGIEKKIETRYLVIKVTPIDADNVIDSGKDVLALFRVSEFKEGFKDSGYVSEDGIIVGTAVREFLPMKEIGEDVDVRHRPILKLLYELDTNSPFHNNNRFTAVYKADDLLSVMIKSMFMICGYHDLNYVDFNTMAGVKTVDSKPDLPSIDTTDTKLITVGMSHTGGVPAGVMLDADIIDIVSNMRKELDPEYVDIPERIINYVDFIKRYATDENFRILDTTAICFERYLTLHGAELFTNRLLSSVINGNHGTEEGVDYIEQATRKVIDADVYEWALEETRSREEVLNTESPDDELVLVKTGDGMFKSTSLTSEGFNAIVSSKLNNMPEDTILINIAHNGKNALFQIATQSKFYGYIKNTILKIINMYSGFDIIVCERVIDNTVNIVEFEIPVKNLGEFWFNKLTYLNELTKTDTLEEN